jgi:RimJ/RimL family protein N-acetyltransferase
LIVCDKSIVGPWIAQQTRMIWKPEGTETIGLSSNGELVAGVWYEDYNPQSIVTHIAIQGRVSPLYLHVIFHYPFVQLCVQKIIAPVLEDNAESIRLVTKMGFKEEARLKDVHPTGDMIFFVMNKKDCKYLGARYGKRLAISTATA